MHKQLHLTGDQIRNIATSGITAKQVIGALNAYVRTTPGYMKAAMRQANKTLTGSWQQLMDILSQASGNAEGGLFGGLHKVLQGVNNQLAPMMSNKKPITIYNVVDAFDKQLSPSTHLVMNVFQLLYGVFQGVAFQLYAMLKVIQLILYPFGHLLGIGRMNEKMFRLLGYALSVLVALWAVGRIRAMQQAIALEYLAARTMIAAVADTILTLATGKGNIAWALRLRRLILTKTATEAVWSAEKKQYVMETRMTGLLPRLRKMYAATATAITGAATATWGWVTATYAESGALGVLRGAIFAVPVIGWVLLLITVLATLYWRWKRFHNAVNDTIGYLWSHPLVAWFVPVIGQVIVLIKLLVTVLQHLHDIANFAGRAKHTVFETALNAVVPGAGILARHATGGYTGGGYSLVGEHGPEIAQFPRGTRIIPNSQIGSASLRGQIDLKVIVTPQPIYIGKQKIAEAVATVKTDFEARA